MIVSLAAVTSINGKMTNGEDSRVGKWASREDQEHFSGLIAAADVMIMGRKTYEAVKPRLRRRMQYYILSRSPALAENTPHPQNLHYPDAAPDDVLSEIKHKGYSNILIAGGGEVNRLFLTAGLVDELYITVEPYLFMNGVDVVAPGQGGRTSARLRSVKQLNEQGTLLLHYALR